jgi:hypothetical protein
MYNHERITPLSSANKKYDFINFNIHQFLFGPLYS